MPISIMMSIRKFLFNDYSFISLCLFGVVLNFYILNNEKILFSIAGIQEEKREFIGRFSEKKLNVEKRTSSQYFWLPISAGDNLYQGDWVLTGPASTTLIKLKHYQLELGENTLVYFSKNNDKSFLDLQYGNLIASLKKGQNLHLNEKESSSKIVAKSNNVKIKLSKQKNKLQVAVKKGDIEIDSKSDIQVNKKFINFTKPIQNSKVWSKPGKHIHIELNDVPPAGSHLLVFLDGKRVLKTSLKGKRIRGKFKSEGEFKLTLINSQGEILDENRFTLHWLKSPEPIYPLSGELLANDLTHLDFSWKERPAVSEYRVQVAHDQFFNEKIEDYSTPKPYFSLKRNGDQKDLFWRVGLPLGAEEKYLWSEPQFVTFFKPSRLGKNAKDLRSIAHANEPPEVLATTKEEVETKPPPPPLITNKEITETLHYDHQNYPVLKWDGQGKEFEVEIGKDNSFLHNTAKLNAENNHLSWKTPTAGTFFWRVRIKDGPWSNPGKLTLNYPAPKFTQDKYIYKVSSREPATLNLAQIKKEIQWKELPGAQSYKLEVYSTKEKKLLLSKYSKGTSYEIHLQDIKDEELLLKLKAQSISERWISSPSSQATLELEKELILPRPKLNLPPNLTEVYPMGEGTSKTLIFSWDEISQATQYELQIAENSNFTNPRINKFSTNTVSLSTPVTNTGQLFWRVRALHQLGKSQWSETFEFKIKK